MAILLISLSYYLSYFHEQYKTDIKNMNKEIITTIIPFIYPLLEKPEVLKKQFEVIMKQNPKIRYILIEKNNKYFLHVTNFDNIEENILLEPTLLTQQIADSEYKLSLNYYDTLEYKNIYLKKESLILSIIIFISFLVTIFFIKQKLSILNTIRKQLEKKVPNSIRTSHVESIITNITKIIEHNDKNEEELKKLQTEFEDQLNLKTASLINEIKERKKAELRFESSINEKVILLKEIHHRVKNNLAIVTSFIRMQARQISDPEIKNIFLNLQNRVKTMELIHTNLYSSKDFTQINFKSYVYSLIRNIQNTFTNSENIVFSVTSNDIKLDIEQAIACGQIINELITNSFKHAFSFEEEGKISIELFKEKNLYVLIFSDSGKKTKDFYENSKKSKSLGITIVQELTKYQLKGTLEIHNENGVKYKIYFQKS